MLVAGRVVTPDLLQGLFLQPVRCARDEALHRRREFVVALTVRCRLVGEALVVLDLDSGEAALT